MAEFANSAADLATAQTRMAHEWMAHEERCLLFGNSGKPYAKYNHLLDMLREEGLV